MDKFVIGDTAIVVNSNAFQNRKGKIINYNKYYDKLCIQFTDSDIDRSVVWFNRSNIEKISQKEQFMTNLIKSMKVDDFKKIAIGEICYFNLSEKNKYEVVDHSAIMEWEKGDELRIISIEHIMNDVYLPVFWNMDKKSASTLLREYNGELCYLKERENSREFEIQKRLAEKYADSFPLNHRNRHERKIVDLLQQYTEELKNV